MTKTTKTHGGSRKGAGRPKSSPGWASITIRLPLPIVEAYRALPEEERAAVMARLRRVVEGAIEM